MEDTVREHAERQRLEDDPLRTLESEARRALFDSLDIADLAERLAEADRSMIRVSFAFRGIKQYVEAARLQVQRIHEEIELSRTLRPALPWPKPERERNRELSRQSFSLMQRAYYDVHYYLICWRMIARFTSLISRSGNFPGIQRLATRHSVETEREQYYRATNPKTLGWYAAGRSHFEHFDERIPEGKNANELLISFPPSGDLPNKNLVIYDGKLFVHPTLDEAGILTIGNKMWDVSPASFSQLESIVGEMEDLVRQVLIPRLDEQMKQQGIDQMMESWRKSQNPR